MNSRPIVHGPTVDDQTRCVHYSTEVDIVAIEFACCGRFYPCHACHAEVESHEAQQWPRSKWDEQAILCGACGALLTIADYRSVDACPQCNSAFNPRCRLHSHLYFEE